MKLLTTALGSYLTGDDIADAVVEYSQELTQQQLTDLVDIPIRIDEATSRLKFSIGWQIPLHAIDAPPDGAELVDELTLQSLRTRRAHIAMGTAAPETSDPWDGQADFFDYD